MISVSNIDNKYHIMMNNILKHYESTLDSMVCIPANRDCNNMETEMETEQNSSVTSAALQQCYFEDFIDDMKRQSVEYQSRAVSLTTAFSFDFISRISKV